MFYEWQWKLINQKAFMMWTNRQEFDMLWQMKKTCDFILNSDFKWNVDEYWLCQSLIGFFLNKAVLLHSATLSFTFSNQFPVQSKHWYRRHMPIKWNSKFTHLHADATKNPDCRTSKMQQHKTAGFAEHNSTVRFLMQIHNTPI